jgi:hypothetical protein
MPSIALFFLLPVNWLKERLLRLLLLQFIIVVTVQCGQAQTDKYDIIGYTAPAGWKKEIKNGFVSYSIANTKNNTFCLVSIYKGAASKGSPDADFTSDWQELVAKPYQITAAPVMSEAADQDGKAVRLGSAQFSFNNTPTMALLTTITGNQQLVSILTFTNSQDYVPQLEGLLGSIHFQAPDAGSQATTQTTIPPQGPASTTTAAKADGYQFTTSQFDDGWTGTVQEDWVALTKNNIKVLLHYNQPGARTGGLDPNTLTQNAWNLLVSPRYNDLSGFVTKQNMSYEMVMFGAGTVTDKASGRQVYVVLFQQGNTPWMEFICPDKNTFVQTFGVVENFDGYANTEYFKELIKMSGYNRFAVAASDLPGTWTNNFTGLTQYVNAYTGASAGAMAHSSGTTYSFAASGSYHWELSVAGGMVGNQRFQQVKSDGKFSLSSNWEMYFSDIEGKPRTYPVHFSCIKGARLLWIEGTAFGKGK